MKKCKKCNHKRKYSERSTVEILLIEDHQSTGLDLQEKLQSTNLYTKKFNLDLITSASEVLRNLGSCHYDLIISDLGEASTGGNSYHLIEKIRDECPSIPIIGITSWRDLRKIKAEAQDYFDRIYSKNDSDLIKNILGTLEDYDLVTHR